MTNKNTPTPPTRGELLELLNAVDPLTLVLRGHQAVDSVLNCILQETLPEPHEVELSRLSFGLKVDLAIALQALRSDSRPLFMSVNRIRNHFAHDLAASFDEKHRLGLIQSLSKFHRHLLGVDPSDLDSDGLLRRVIGILFVECQSAAKRVRDNRDYCEAGVEILMRELEESQKEDQVSLEEKSKGIAKAHDEILQQMRRKTSERDEHRDRQDANDPKKTLESVD